MNVEDIRVLFIYPGDDCWQTFEGELKKHKVTPRVFKITCDQTIEEIDRAIKYAREKRVHAIVCGRSMRLSTVEAYIENQPADNKVVVVYGNSELMHNRILQKFRSKHRFDGTELCKDETEVVYYLTNPETAYNLS